VPGQTGEKGQFCSRQRAGLSQSYGGATNEEEIILFWRTINILSIASWQDRGAAAVRLISLRCRSNIQSL